MGLAPLGDAFEKRRYLSGQIAFGHQLVLRARPTPPWLGRRPFHRRKITSSNEAWLANSLMLITAITEDAFFAVDVADSR